jgi:hypothetical protein
VPGTGLLCLEHSSAAAGWAKPEVMDGRAHRTGMPQKFIETKQREVLLVPGTGLLCLEHSSAAAGWAKPEAMDGRAHRTGIQLKFIETKQREVLLVPGTGIEPVRSFPRGILSYLCPFLTLFDNPLKSYIYQLFTHFAV